MIMGPPVSPNSSTSETGHAKNVANFKDLIAVCTGPGSSYNPANASIKPAELNSKFIFPAFMNMINY